MRCGLYRGAVPAGQLPLRRSGRTPGTSTASSTDLRNGSLAGVPPPRRRRPRSGSTSRPSAPPACHCRQAGGPPPWWPERHQASPDAAADDRGRIRQRAAGGGAGDGPPNGNDRDGRAAHRARSTMRTRSRRLPAHRWLRGCCAGALAARTISGARRGPGGEPAGTWRCRLPRRGQVGLLPAERLAPLPGRQRRRERAGHLQGPPAHGARPAPAHRGLSHRLLRAGAVAVLPLRARRDGPGGRAHRRRPERGVRRRLRGLGHLRQRLLAWTSCCTPARAPTSWARRRRSSRAWKATAACPASSRHTFLPRSACTASPPSSTTWRRLSNLPWIVTHGAAAFVALGSEKSAGTRVFAVIGPRSQSRRVRGAVRCHHLR